MRSYITACILANLALLPGEMGLGALMCLQPHARLAAPMEIMLLCMLGFFISANVIIGCLYAEAAAKADEQKESNDE